jgi:lysozyme
MKASERCIAQIKHFEGFRPTPYRDSVGVLTIGYGETRHITPVDAITESEADLMLRAHCAELGSEISALVHVSLTQGQTDALIDFAYNLGAAALGKSTLLEKLNEGDYETAANEFDRWIHADGKVLPGLVRRRRIEREWFTEPARPYAAQFIAPAS